MWWVLRLDIKSMLHKRKGKINWNSSNLNIWFEKDPVRMRRQGTDQEENLCKTYVQQKIYVKKSQTLNYKRNKRHEQRFQQKTHKTKHTERRSIWFIH